MHDRGLSYDRTTAITVILGFVEERGGNYYGLDSAFDLPGLHALEALASFCDDVMAQKHLRAFEVKCWPKTFLENVHKSAIVSDFAGTLRLFF